MIGWISELLNIKQDPFQEKWVCISAAEKYCFDVDDKGHFNGIVGYDNGGNVVFVKIPRKHVIDQYNTFEDWKNC